MSLVLWLLIVLGLCYLVHCKWRLLRLGSSLPGPWALPLLGNAQMIGKLKPEFIFLVFTELRERFGATYRLWLGPQLWVFLYSAEETRAALHDATLRKAATFEQLQPLIGNGLLISHGQLWTAQRRLLVPAFQPQLLRSFAPALERHADRLLSRLDETQGEAFEVTDCLFACLLDAIVDTSMGRQLNTQLAPPHSSPITAAFHRTSELLFKRMINPLLTFDFVFQRTRLWRQLKEQLQVIHALMDSIIDERAEQLEKETEEEEDQEQLKMPRNLLDTLLKANTEGGALSRQQIRDEVNTFVFAGVDTTTAALCFVLYALAKYPAAQSQLSDELQAIPHEEPDRLPYLDMLLKEVLRFYTIVPTTGRQTTQPTRIGHRSYCAGVTLWLNFYGLAHDPRYFPQPYEFRPERWAAGETPPPIYSYLPFSGGPHACIGRRYSLLLLKLLTARIVRAFRLELANPGEQLVLQAQMVLRARNGINLRFVRR